MTAVAERTGHPTDHAPDPRYLPLVVTPLREAMEGCRYGAQEADR